MMAKRAYDIPAVSGDEVYKSVVLEPAPDGSPSQIVVKTSLRVHALEPGGMGRVAFDALWAQLDTLTEPQKQAALDALPEIEAVDVTDISKVPEP